MTLKTLAAATAAFALAASPSFASPDNDRRIVAALDTAYQEAVERNDADAMAEVLTDDMVVVMGNGLARSREDLLRAARERHIVYERQIEDEGTQAVRLFGSDTAVVTARLWVKGRRAGGDEIDVRLWFSDTYVRTPEGWRYAFGQASLPLAN